MKVVELTTKKELKKLYDTSCFTWEGMSDSKENLEAIEKAIRENGFKEDEMLVYKYTGKLMNDSYKLTGSNAYPDNLTFISIPNYYNPIFKLQCGARWFDDIVANNEREEKRKNGEV